MKTISISDARNNIKSLIDRVKHNGEVFAIGRHNSIEALIIQFPLNYNKDLNDITNINTYSKSFDFLASEPDIYSKEDLKKFYA